MSSTPSSNPPVVAKAEDPIVAELEVMPPGDHRQVGPRPQNQALAWIIQHFMDNLFHLPGTRARFGLTPLLELIPGIGDGASVLISAVTIVEAARRRVPKIVMARMALNIMLNGLIGIIPFAGEAFSFWFKPSTRNYQLLQRHLAGSSVAPQRASGSDWAFVIVLLVAMTAVIGLFVIVGGYIAYKFIHLAFYSR